MTLEYAVVFERTPNNYSAYVPDLPGCVTTGQTLEEVERNMREAIMFHIESLKEHGELIPETPHVDRGGEGCRAAGGRTLMPMCAPISWSSST